MAYARFSDGDVYVFEEDGWTCCACKLSIASGKNDPVFDNLTDLKRHLDDHVKVGHVVSSDCFDRIDYEMTTGVGLLSGDPVRVI